MSKLSFANSTEEATTSLSFKVDGMSCASCAGRVEKSLNSVPSVQQASINLATEKAQVILGAGVSAKEIVEAVESAGYEVPQTEFDLKIEGMTCSSCANRVEKALLGVRGVSGASVNLATEVAYVSAISEEVSIETLKQAVIDAGYDAKPESEVGKPRLQGSGSGSSPTFSS